MKKKNIRTFNIKAIRYCLTFDINNEKQRYHSKIWAGTTLDLLANIPGFQHKIWAGTSLDLLANIPGFQLNLFLPQAGHTIRYHGQSVFLVQTGLTGNKQANKNSWFKSHLNKHLRSSRMKWKNVYLISNIIHVCTSGVLVLFNIINNQ